MTRRSRAEEEEAARALREVAARAARRLAWLEWAIYALAAVLAVAAGALVGVLLSDAFGLPFRPSWMVASMLLFIVPASLSYRRVRRDRRAMRSRSSPNTDESDG